MAQQLTGEVEILNSSSKFTTIVLNGNRGTLSAGGLSDYGELVLKDNVGNTRIRLDTSSWAPLTIGSQPAIHLNGYAGNIILRNAYAAEEFDVPQTEDTSPGTVMVIDKEDSLRTSKEAYDKKVVGVVSGAGECHPGIVLDRQNTAAGRVPVALMGKAYCRVDASYGAIEVGDLLTTSPTPGHAMKAADHNRVFGAVIGKALRPLMEGRGLVLILIALQ